MSEFETDISRRAMFAVGGLGLIAVSGAAGSAAAAVPSPAEKANLKLVNEFCKVWNAKDLDLDKAVSTYLADDCSIRLVEGQPPAVGKAAAVELFKSFIKNGERYDLKVVESFAKGPVVANSRIDTTIAPGKKPEAVPVAGVFIVKDGKIREWSDYPVATA